MTLCKYDLKKGDLFIRSKAWVRRLSRESISSGLLMYGVGVRSILIDYLSIIDVCIWYICVFMSVVVTV